MRASGAMFVGAVIGAAVVWVWGREMEEYVAEKTRGVRTKAAEGIRAVEETAGKVLDRSGADNDQHGFHASSPPTLLLQRDNPPLGVYEHPVAVPVLA